MRTIRLLLLAAMLPCAHHLLTPLLLAQGRTIGSFPYDQSFAFITSTTTAFPAANTDGGEFTADAATSAAFSSGTSAGLQNAGGGALAIQTNASSPQLGFILHLDLGVTSPGELSIAWRKVRNGTAGTRANELRVATNGGSGSTFTDIGGVTWPSFVNSNNAESGTLSVQLPGSLAGGSAARVRIYSVNTGGSGSHPKVVLDDLRVTNSDEHLPVELAGFELASRDARVFLSWRTASEIDNAGFELGRATEGDSLFTVIASYLSTAELAGLGTSASGRSYRFIDGDDGSLRPGATYRYRLVDISTDGTRREHPAASVRIEGSVEAPEPRWLRVEPIAPNPADARGSLGFHLPEPAAVTIEILDASGTLVARPIAGRMYDAGSHREELDLSTLPPGSYTLRFRTPDRGKVQRLTVIR